MVDNFFQTKKSTQISSESETVSSSTATTTTTILQVRKTKEGKPRLGVILHEGDQKLSTNGTDDDDIAIPAAMDFWNASVTHHGRVVGIATSGGISEDKVGSGQLPRAPPALVGLDVMQIELVPLPSEFLQHLASIRTQESPQTPTGERELTAEIESGGRPVTRNECISCFQRMTSLVDLEGEFFHYFTTYFTEKEWRWIRLGLPTSSTSPSRSDVIGNSEQLWRERAEHETSKGVVLFAQLWRFFINWVLKESYIKAIGIGLGLSLQSAEFSINEKDIVDANEDRNSDRGRQETYCRPLPLSVSLALNGKEQKEWQFTVFDVQQWNTVAALAVGPCGDAVDPSVFLNPMHRPLPREVAKEEGSSSVWGDIYGLHAELVTCESVLESLYGM